MSKYSSTNRITSQMIVEAATGKFFNLCRGSFGTQSDAQCMGYDRLCALAALLYKKCDGGTEKAVYLAQMEIRDSPYSLGFQHGWDDQIKSKDVEEEYRIGYVDGKNAAEAFRWRRGFRPSYSSGR